MTLVANMLHRIYVKISQYPNSKYLTRTILSRIEKSHRIGLEREKYFRRLNEGRSWS